MTPSGVKQRVTEKSFGDADDASRRHEQKICNWDEHRGKCI